MDRVRDAGLQGPDLRWIKSFLEDRSQSVRLSHFTVPNLKSTCGVPQGSSLSPHLFILYLLPLILSLRERNVSTFNYADDLQLIFTIDKTSDSILNFQSTMLHIRNRMNSNHLKLNPDKTELILIGGVRNPWSPNSWSIKLGSPQAPSSSAKSLGVTIYCDLSMKSQIGTVVSTCFFQLRKIRKISRLLTREALVQAVLSLVISHIDYTNSLYFGVPSYLVKR